MTNPERRAFLARAAAIAGTGCFGAGVHAQAPGGKLDLIVKGGEVIDPARGMRAHADVGIRAGRIAAVEPDIPAAQAARVVDAGGKLVTPGLIDLHAHVFAPGAALGLPPGELVARTAATTLVSAGDAGADGFAAFRRHVSAHARLRVYAFVHIARTGLSGHPAPEMLDIAHADADAAARTIAENHDMVLGVTVRQSAKVVGSNGLEPLRRAIAAVERAQTRGRVMCHIGGVPGAASELSTLLELLRPGDILTHAYSGAGNDVVQQGKLVSAALAARKRGVIIDVGHGDDFDYAVAEAAIAQGLVPDVISSDLHAGGNSPGMPYLPWVMSKFLNMGFGLEQVIAMTTVNPARIIGREPKLGTLELDAPADVSILELVEAPVTFVDARRSTRPGTRSLRPVQAIRAGVPFGKPSRVPIPMS